MDYEDMVDETDETPLEDVTEKPAGSSKNGLGLKAVILTGLLAGLIGTTGGAAAVYFGLKTQTPNMTSVTSDIRQSMSRDIKKLETRISEIDIKAQDAMDRPDVTVPSVDLTPLETRLEALEAATQTEISPETLSAIKAAEEDEFQWPDMSELEARMRALEKRPQGSSENAENFEARLEVIEKRVASTKPSSVPNSLMTRIEALENRPQLQPKPELLPVLALPSDAMIEVVEGMNDGGFLQRTLSKHVRVKDDDDPRTLIAGMEKDIAEGRLDLALNKYERLPEPVRTVGQAWSDSAKQANVKAAK